MASAVNWLELAAAVTGQTCEDYCYARRKLNRYLNEGRHLTDIVVKNQISILQDCLEYFYNDMSRYSIIYIEPKKLLSRLNYVADHEDEYRVVRFLKNTTSLKEEIDG